MKLLEKMKKPLCFLPVYAVFLLIMTEWISRGSIIAAFVWLVPHIGVALVGALLLTGILAVLFFLSRRLKVAMWTTSLPLVILAIVNYYKILMNSKPLTIWDFGLVDELLKIQGDMSFVIAWHVVIAVIIVIAMNLVLGRFFTVKPRPEVKWHTRAWQTLLALTSVAALFFGVYLQPTLFEKLGFDDTPYNQVDFYKNNGFVNSLLYGINDKLALSRAQATPEAQQLLAAEKTFYAESTAPEKQPNIILLLNESFMDVTKIPNITLNQDPLPTYRSLLDQTLHGQFVSSQFGGGTSNVEYDVLTGNTSFDLPKGMVPYTQLIHQEMDSLPQLLKAYGYQNTSIHSYTGWFWNRETIHKYLGFEQLLDETTFVEPDRVGPYISDADFMAKIIETFETNKAANPEKPQFIFGISMQNHAPYGGVEKSIGDESPIEIVASQGLSPEDTEVLEDYAQSTYLSDQALADLLAYFESVDEPTIVVQFGDHLPSMGTLLSNAGYLNNPEQDKLTQDLAKYTTPVIFWDNYGGIAQAPTKDLGYIGSNYVAPMLMQAAGLPLSPYYQFLQTMKTSVGMPFFEYMLLPDGTTLTKDATVEQLLATYRYTQYQLLSGNK